MFCFALTEEASVNTIAVEPIEPLTKVPAEMVPTGYTLNRLDILDYSCIALEVKEYAGNDEWSDVL